ncbi:hypothetical protein XM52_28370 [Roseovarius indicus]|nr:hypothetical protein XM52_28370 [Roseovarius indicus]
MNSKRKKVFFSIKEVADTLGVNERTVRRWITVGDLSGHRVGRQWRISLQDIEAFLSERYSRAHATSAKVLFWNV